ncbi:hypothetical protein ACJX0J_023625, partial [Zea mays]
QDATFKPTRDHGGHVTQPRLKFVKMVHSRWDPTTNMTEIPFTNGWAVSHLILLFCHCAKEFTTKGILVISVVGYLSIKGKMITQRIYKYSCAEAPAILDNQWLIFITTILFYTNIKIIYFLWFHKVPRKERDAAEIEEILKRTCHIYRCIL